MSIEVFLPRDHGPAFIDPGSGIVGTPQPGSRTLVDYEGNRNGAQNIVTFADRVHHAAGRHLTGYPTIARSLLDSTALEPIGTFDDTTGEITLASPTRETSEVAQILCAWIGVDIDNLPAQLLAGGHRFEMRREVLAGLSSHDPMRRFTAQQMNSRHRLGL